MAQRISSVIQYNKRTVAAIFKIFLKKDCEKENWKKGDSSWNFWGLQIKTIFLLERDSAIN